MIKEKIKSYEYEITYTTKVIRELLDYIEVNKDGLSSEYINEKYLRIEEAGKNLVICHQNIYNLKRELDTINLNI